MKKLDYNKGFTLIELLVVIAVIGILAAVILGSLGSARSKAKDKAIIQGVKQFQILLNLEYNEKGTYAGLQGDAWIPLTKTCANIVFSSANYAVKARAICSNIISNITNTSSSGYTGNAYFYTGTTATAYSKEYSIMALLSDGTYFCVGSGGTSIGTYGPWNTPGCFYTP